MRVHLVGEGTYPVVRGGVGTWSDQLVRGLADVDFSVTVLTAGRSSAAYELPPNVGRVSAVDMWGPIPAHKTIKARHWTVFEEAWEVICGHAYGRGGRTPQVTLSAWLVLTRPEIAERLWWLINDRRSLALLNAVRMRAGEEPSSGRDLASAVAYLGRMIMPCGLPPVEADVIHVTSGGSSLLAGLPSYVQGAPIVLSEHGVFFRERLLALRGTDWSFLQRSLVGAFLKSITRVGYEAASAIAPVSDFNGRWAAAMGADVAKLATVHNGVDTARFRSVAPEPEVPTLVFVGRIDPLKDLATLIQAVPFVAQSIPDVRLSLIGPVPETNKQYADDLMSLVSELGMTDRIAFAGSTSDPVSAYCTGTVAVLSSISEGFPYGVLEPMACERPVVATNVGGVPEVVGDAGLLVPSRDPRAMADACSLLLADEGERRRLAARGRERVEQRFTLQRMLDRLRGLYWATARPDDVRLPEPSAATTRALTARGRVDLAASIVPYLPAARGPEWAYDMIRSEGRT